MVLDKHSFASQASPLRNFTISDKISESYIKIGTTSLGIKKKLFITQHPFKQKAEPKNAGSLSNQLVKRKSSYSDMNASSPNTRIMPLLKQYFGLTANAALWKTSLKRLRLAFIWIRLTEPVLFSKLGLHDGKPFGLQYR